MSKLIFLSLVLGFSPLVQAACEPVSVEVFVNLENVPAQEMTTQNGFTLQNCVSVADFIARHTIASRAAPARPATPYSGGNRFNMTQNGKKMTADDFDAWMREKGIRVAGGKAPEQEQVPVVACTPTKKKPCPK